MKKRNETKTIIDIIQFTFGLLLLLMMLFTITGCSAVKEIPVQYIDRIEYKDTTIFIKDTIKVEVPKEVIKEIVPQDTISVLKTSVAISEAKVEKGMLSHRLEQKGAIPVEIDTIVKVQYVDRYIEKEVPVIQTVEKPVRDNLFWLSIILNIMVALVIGLKIYLKIK